MMMVDAGTDRRTTSDLLSQIQNPELVQVVEAGFDDPPAKITAVQIHHGCRKDRMQAD